MMKQGVVGWCSCTYLPDNRITRTLNGPFIDFPEPIPPSPPTGYFVSKAELVVVEEDFY